MPGSATDTRAQALLRRYRHRFGGPELPVPVDSIAEDFAGLRVTETQGLDCSGLLVPAERRIWVNAREAAESPARRRFTIAHELGHWVCQVLEGRWQPVFCRTVETRVDGAYPPIEREADVFATELLMPAPAVWAAFDGDDSVDGLAERFEVPREAMRRRLGDLGLLRDVR